VQAYVYGVPLVDFIQRRRSETSVTVLRRPGRLRGDDGQAGGDFGTYPTIRRVTPGG
jgi:hypothetical protein